MPDRRQQLAKISEIPGVTFGEELLTTRVRIPMEKLTTSKAQDKLKSALAWLAGHFFVKRFRSSKKNRNKRISA